jgi:hypothetical protein
MLGELRDEALLREVHHNNAILNFKIFRDTASYFNQCGFPPGHQYYVDPRRCDLPRNRPIRMLDTTVNRLAAESSVT